MRKLCYKFVFDVDCTSDRMCQHLIRHAWSRDRVTSPEWRVERASHQHTVECWKSTRRQTNHSLIRCSVAKPCLAHNTTVIHHQTDQSSVTGVQRPIWLQVCYLCALCSAQWSRSFSRTWRPNSRLSVLLRPAFIRPVSVVKLKDRAPRSINYRTSVTPVNKKVVPSQRNRAM